MQQSSHKIITQEVINQAMSYESYRELIREKLAKGETTGPEQSEKLTKYTRLNVQRMNRLDKKTELSDSLKRKLENVQEPWIWLVLTEGWCGDAAQNVPVLNKMAAASRKIELKLLLRDQHLDVMDEYLTNGGRSIPKLICLHAGTPQEIGTWGPRPGDLQHKAMQWKNDPNMDMEEWAEKLHAWYAKDKSQTLQADFEELIAEWGVTL